MGALTVLADNPTITLTEVSDTELDYSWSDGSGSGQLIASVPDNWSTGPDVLPGPGLGINTGGQSFWAEETSLTYNNVSVSVGPAGQTQIFVQSDLNDPPLTPLANGAIFNANGFNIQFFDNGDESGGSVPDAGATASLLGMSLAGLCVAKRKFCR